MQPALPPPGQFISSISLSSRKLCQKVNVTINKGAVERLISSDVFKSLDVVTALPGVALPLNYASVLDELNVLSILAVLNFGSSYDAPLREKTGHGASNAIRALIFSMYITSTSSESDYLSAQGLKSISTATVAEMIGVDLHIEKAHPSLHGVTVGELGGPLYEYVKRVSETLNQTGQVLLDSGYPNLGFLVLEALRGGVERSGLSTTARTEAVVDKLVRALPIFQDMAVVDGEPVYIFSKAIFLLDVISTRFGSITPPPFPIPDVQSLPISADGVVPSILVRLGIIDLSSSDMLRSLWPEVSDEDVRSYLSQQEGVAAGTRVQGPSVSLVQAFCLRAAAIVACETIVEVANSISSLQIYAWLQIILKERPDYQACGSIVEKSTTFF
ncbi:hypothetical protein NMY22_g4810 [Coprinellus aureogranulatus]|nr:hypothetical protein NMY22_g4810 [Coprinellus aureogranulatus]